MNTQHYDATGATGTKHISFPAPDQMERKLSVREGADFLLAYAAICGLVQAQNLLVNALTF